MVFYKKITICNLFAYYGQQSIEFDRQDNKNIYLIYGQNGFGKTSFIRSIKLAFAGSGLLAQDGNVPDIISAFVPKARGAFTPKILLRGTTNVDRAWQGVFNKKAISKQENTFYIELALDNNGKEIIIRREWHIYPELEEKLSFSNEGEIFFDNEAVERMEQILPLKFLQFFIFDGEEIEAMADDISSELGEKIQNILNISILDKLVGQARNVERDLIQQSSIANENKAKLVKLIADQKYYAQSLENTQNIIKSYEKDLCEIKDELDAKERERLNKMVSSSLEAKNLQQNKSTALQNLQNAQEGIKEFAGEILFAGLDNLFDEVLYKIEKSVNTSTLDEKELEKLAKFSAEYLCSKIRFDGDNYDINNALRDAFKEFINNADNDFKGINKALLGAVYEGAKENMVRLYGHIKDVKNLKQTIAEINRRQDEIANSTNIVNEIRVLDDSINVLKAEKAMLDEKLKQNNIKVSNDEKSIADIENEIRNLKDRVGRDERIKSEMDILKELKRAIIAYKNGRIERTTVRLKDEILNNYKRLLPDDNVFGVEIENFAVRLIGVSGESIAVRSQSAGQKQIAAISIFWALSKLSGRILPLIIDTPLARMDARNRKNIIENYYFDASNQVIALPTDTEFTSNEINIAKHKIAGIYQINNGDVDFGRDHASIRKIR
nr:AAA family ATPase [uncultured Campylobacter sp.]